VSIRALFLDVGGVLLTNGWDSDTRRAAVRHFQLDATETESRHRMLFDTYEIGKLTLEDYLHQVVFYKNRRFTLAELKRWIFAQSKAYPLMIDGVIRLKARYGLKVAVVSNEGRELTEYRIRKFQLTRFVDFFVCSSFIHFRKPDQDMYRMALDLIQVHPSQVAYLEDRAFFVEVAHRLGIHAIQHKNFRSSMASLASLGLGLS